MSVNYAVWKCAYKNSTPHYISILILNKWLEIIRSFRRCINSLILYTLKYFIQTHKQNSNKEKQSCWCKCFGWFQTDKEYESKMIGLNADFSLSDRLRTDLPTNCNISGALPKEIDWRAKNCITPVKNQVLLQFIMLCFTIIVYFYLLFIWLDFTSHRQHKGHIATFQL
jgi:hypothetical protein